MREVPTWLGEQGRQLLLPVMELFHEEVQYQSKHPPGEDPVTGAFYSRLLEEPLSSPLSVAIEEMIDLHIKREDGMIMPSVWANNVRASIFTFLMTKTEQTHIAKKFSFNGLDDPKAWDKHFREVNEALGNTYSSWPTDRATDALNSNLLINNVQTTISDRNGPLELVMQSLRERFPDGIDWLEEGCGIMLGAQQMLLKDRYPFNFNSVGLLGDNFERKNARLTHKANRLVKRSSLLNNVVCVDLVPVYHNGRAANSSHASIAPGYDPSAVEWARGSLRPSEYSNPSFMKKFNGLLVEKSPKITFTRADLSDEVGAEKFEDRHPGKKFDVISFLTVLHQMSGHKRHMMMERGKSLLKPGGIMVIQDFGYLPPARRPLPISSLQMYRHWHSPGRYRTFVYDSDHQIPGLQEAFRSKDSRCKDLAVVGARMIINNQTYPLSDIIKNA